MRLKALKPSAVLIILQFEDIIRELKNHLSRYLQSQSSLLLFIDLGHPNLFKEVRRFDSLAL